MFKFANPCLEHRLEKVLGVYGGPGPTAMHHNLPTKCEPTNAGWSQHCPIKTNSQWDFKHGNSQLISVSEPKNTHPQGLYIFWDALFSWFYAHLLNVLQYYPEPDIINWY